MAHGDYDCCAICDSKMNYAAFDSQTKEKICPECLRAAHGVGIMVYTATELVAWIRNNPEEARRLLPNIGFSECFYPNEVDAAFKDAKRKETTDGKR